MIRSATLRAALVPFSWLYRSGVSSRAALYRAGVFPRGRLDGIVVSVGNLTVGGTGKTPFVAWMAQTLKQQGQAVGVLLRGYRGSGGASDEAELLRARLGAEIPVGVGADRFRQGKALAQNGVNCFLLDDGFQHLRLERDADIVLVDAKDPFGGARMLPAGRLREPLSALSRADIVVITRSDHAPDAEARVRRFTVAPVFYATTVLEEIRPGKHSRVEWPAAAWLGKRAFAFCGIGNPQAFFDDARGWGVALTGTMTFRDHHRYTPRDAAEIERRAAAAGSDILLATEKDACNLGELRFERLPIYHPRVTMRVTQTEKFWEALETAINRHRDVLDE